MHFLLGLDPVATPGRYRTSVLAVVVMEMAIASAAGVVWLEDDPYPKAMGAEVVEADGGPEALRLVAAGGIDPVLLDMAMPGKDGFETFRRLRARPDRAARAVPVVAMVEQRAAVAAAGLDGFIAKPLLPEQLAAVLDPRLTLRKV